MDILKELLEIERERLRTAVRIEQERKIVFPETSVIIHDIEKLIGSIERYEKPEPVQAAKPAGKEKPSWARKD